jgi:hypothetical protein
VTVTDAVFVAVAPALSVTFSVTAYVPAAAYVWLGFAVVAVPPSPNVHARAVIVPSESVDVSVKLATSMFALDVKFAVGGTLPPVSMSTSSDR